MGPVYTATNDDELPFVESSVNGPNFCFLTGILCSGRPISLLAVPWASHADFSPGSCCSLLSQMFFLHLSYPCPTHHISKSCTFFKAHLYQLCNSQGCCLPLSCGRAGRVTNLFQSAQDFTGFKNVKSCISGTPSVLGKPSQLVTIREGVGKLSSVRQWLF